MKQCSKCTEVKTFESFAKDKERLHSWCKPCHREWSKRHYLENKQYYAKKARVFDKERRKRVREIIIDYLLSHPCIDCGEKDILVLEFDHRGDKKFAISDFRHQNIELIKAEINKCEVRCANCHRRKTAVDFKWNKLKYLPS